MTFTAHYRESDKAVQTVKSHLLHVRALAESYGETLGVQHITGLAGMLHDIGKYSTAFQHYLRLAVFEPEHALPRGSVDHATAGGKLLFDRYHNPRKANKLTVELVEVVGNAIFSHHSYLHDYIDEDLNLSFVKRAKKEGEQLPEYDQTVALFFNEVMDEKTLDQYVKQATVELDVYLKARPVANLMELLTLLARFVLSCLIDADRTDTRLFEENKRNEPEKCREMLFNQYCEALYAYLQKLKIKPGADNPINQLRREMSDQCERFAARPSGIYTLSIPTGGGKTLASLRYALQHARRYHKRQIIYIVPFTTIIEQNAAVIRCLLNDDANILEHHSNIAVTGKEECFEGEALGQEDRKLSLETKLSLAKDNWDCPIILTTMVQFLDTFYKKGSRNIRRLHHLTESVIIFDEVQKVPVRCVTLFNQAVNFLKTFGRSSILLCTATQPALDYVRHQLAINEDGEIIAHLSTVTAAFKRIRIIDRASKQSITTDTFADFIAERLDTVNNALVILNTRSAVRKFYQSLNDRFKNTSVKVFHLSTSMCAAHREKLLKDIRTDLKDKNVRLICISTQLIEAGVDVSFECVIRSLAGLDSIAQAAGRCNRNGECEGLRDVFVIDYVEEHLTSAALTEIRVGKAITRDMLRELADDPSRYGGDILSPEAMRWYFKCFFEKMKAQLDYPLPDLGTEMTMHVLLGSNTKNGFSAEYRHKMGHPVPLIMGTSPRLAAEHFHVIEEMTQSIIVPYDKGKDIIADLNGAASIESLGALLRQAQHYSVNLWSQETAQLDRQGELIPYVNGQVFALRESAYNTEFGLNIGENGGGGFDAY